MKVKLENLNSLNKLNNNSDISCAELLPLFCQTWKASINFSFVTRLEESTEIVKNVYKLLNQINLDSIRNSLKWIVLSKEKNIVLHKSNFHWLISNNILVNYDVFALIYWLWNMPVGLFSISQIA